MSAFEFDAFISYNRNDREFARRLERDVERFIVPKALGASRRRMKVFRDTDDMTGTDYEKAIRRHLDDSRKLIVVCSPSARQSSFVNGEINYFIEGHSPESIIPVMLEGIPNNETDDESLYTFPPALEEAMGMPLGIDYRSWRAGPLSKRRFRDQWYTLLAELLDTSRDQVEQRDRQQKTVRWSLAGGLAVIVLSVTGFQAYYQTWTNGAARATAVLEGANGIANERNRVKELIKLRGLPERTNTIEELLATAQALSDPSYSRLHEGEAEMRWNQREGNPIVSNNIMPLLGNTLDPECTFEQPPTQNLTGRVSPDGTLHVYLIEESIDQLKLFIQRADGFGVASVYCLWTGDNWQDGPFAEKWRVGTEELEGRIGFVNTPVGPEVIVKDINQKILHKVPANRPGASTLWLTNINSAKFGSEGELLVTHEGRSDGRIKLLPPIPGDNVLEDFVYKGSEEEPAADYLVKKGHPGLKGKIDRNYSKVRGAYLDDRQIIAMVLELEQNAEILAFRLPEYDRVFQQSTFNAECTVFGHRSMSYCIESAFSLSEAGVVRWDAGSETRMPLVDENWSNVVLADAVASKAGRKILIWGTPIQGTSADSPAYVWLDDEVGRPPFLTGWLVGEEVRRPFLIDRSPSFIKQAAFRPDGQYLFILREDGTLKLWSFETEALLTELGERVADLAL